MINGETLIGIMASVLTASSLLPQLIKLVKEKEAKDVSIVMLIVLLIGLICWVWYGFLKQDQIIIISNSFSLLVNVITILLTLKYKKQ